ncbi:terminase [Actinomyces howellii]|nr:terminase [Actinomyces howellii]
MLPGYWVDSSTGAWMTLPWPGDPSLPWNHHDRLALLPPTLGPQVIAWAEAYLKHHLTGEPWRFTVGQKRFLYLWYAINPTTGRFIYRSGVKRGAKGTGKDPTASALSWAEACGPVQLDGFDANGQPVGVERGMSKVQIAANSLSQAREVLDVVNGMITDALADDYAVDDGLMRTVTSVGRIELLTASEKSQEGAPATAVFLNESHHMTASSGGHKIAAVARRNVGKSPAYIQARVLELTNAHLSGQDSVAEQSFLAWQAQQRPNAPRRDILYDSIEAPPSSDIFDEESRMRGLRAAYSDAPWADLERISDEMLDTRTPVSDSIRYYFNGLGVAEDAWVSPARFDAMASPRELAEGDKVALFLDCSKSEDATGLVGCRLADGYVFVLGVWQRPHGHRGKDWLAPRQEVDAVVRNAFERYRVAWFGVDPSPARDDSTEALYWGECIDSWHRDLRHKVSVWATPGAGGSAVLFDMRMSARGGVLRNQAFTDMAMRTAMDIDDPEEGSPFPHDGNPALRVHTHNARRRPNKWGYTLGKVNRDSDKLVDLAVCMVGARLGAKIALDSGKVSVGASKRRRRRGGVLR